VNNNFNVMALTDSTGTVAERYKYDPYGACTVTLDDSSGNPFRFQSRRLDAETGLYYFRNRYLSPTLGRFMQRDPVGYADGMNLYECVRSQPTAASDAMGLVSPRSIWKCVKSILEAEEEGKKAMKKDADFSVAYTAYMVCCRDAVAEGRCCPTAGGNFQTACLKDECVQKECGKAIVQRLFREDVKQAGKLAMKVAMALKKCAKMIAK